MHEGQAHPTSACAPASARLHHLCLRRGHARASVVGGVVMAHPRVRVMGEEARVSGVVADAPKRSGAATAAVARWRTAACSQWVRVYAEAARGAGPLILDKKKIP